MANVEPVRVAVLGGGRMGRMHVAALARARGAGLAGVVEPVEAVRAPFAAEGVTAWESVDALLDARSSVDAAIVAAPTDLHLELVTRLTGAGLAVLCEKPCGLRADETVRAVRAAADAGVVFQVGYWRRFVPALRDLRARLASGALGEPLFVSCWQWDAAPPPQSFRVRSGGILLDMGVHEFDQLRWLTGRELEHVVAYAGATEGDAADPDSVTALAQLGDGAVAAVSLGRMFPHGDCCWVELMATRGHARERFVWGAEGVRVFEQALVAQAEAFASAVRGETQEGATGEDAVHAIEVAEVATRSLVVAAPA